MITTVGTETPTGREMIETAQLYPRSCRNWSRNSSDDNPTSSLTFDESTVNDFTGTINKPDGVDTDSVKTITPKNGGTLSVNTSSGTKIDLSVPGGAVGSGEGTQVSIKSVDPNNLPKPPAKATQGSSSGTFKFGSSVMLQFDWYWDQLAAAYPDRVPGERPDGYSTRLQAIVGHNLGLVPIFSTDNDRSHYDSFGLVEDGELFRVE